MTDTPDDWRDVGARVVDRHRDKPMAEDDHERIAAINAELREGFRAWADAHGVVMLGTPSPLAEIALTLNDEHWGIQIPGAVLDAFEAAVRLGAKGKVTSSAGLFGEFVAKTRDALIPHGTLYEARALDVPIIACGRSWSRAIQVDGGPYTHRGSGLPFAYCRFEQLSAHIEWHEGPAGRFFTCHGNEFVLAESAEAAGAWVANYREHGKRLAAKFAEAMKGVGAGRRLPMMTLGPGPGEHPPKEGA